LGEGEKGMGSRKGGEVSIQPTRDLSGRESHHNAKEGFQVRRELRNGGRDFEVKGVIKRIGLCSPTSCQSCTFSANRVYVVLIKNCV
jgi:hypothetical protein